MKYLIYCQNDNDERIGAWVDVPSDFTGDDYGDLQENFVKAHGKKNPELYDKYAEMRKFWSHSVVTAHGIFYDEELAGPGGASFEVFQLPENTKEQIHAAKAELRAQRDVVSLRVIRIHKIVEWNLT